MQCPSCKEPFSPDWLFCPHCGTIVEAPLPGPPSNLEQSPSQLPHPADLEPFREQIMALLEDCWEHNGEDPDIDALVTCFDPAQFELLQHAARIGWPEAEWLLSRCYWQGWVVPLDPIESIRFCEEAARKGEALALYDLGVHCATGYGVELDPARAAQLYRQAAGTGLPRAQYRLAECYLMAGNGEWEISEAVFWLRTAARQGYAPAAMRLATLYIAEGQRAMPRAEGASWLNAAAKQDHPDAQYHLAQCCLRGEGVPVDPERAMGLFISAAALYNERARDPKGAAQCYLAMAQMGAPAAQYQLACCYAQGNGLPQDYREAIRWLESAIAQHHEDARQMLPEVFREFAQYLSTAAGGSNLAEIVHCLEKAAALGNVAACLQLAECHAAGKGVPKNMPEACGWFRKAAEAGDTAAQFRLAICLLSGDGVPCDDHEAYRWFRSAANAGYAPAQFKMALQLSAGTLLPKDPVSALRYLESAAEQGYVRAQSTLGEWYAMGKNTPKNWSQAVKWINTAANAGDGHARDLLRRYNIRK